MAQNSFVYDPSASIKEGFKDVSSNISTAFTNIIAQKQQDLALADKVFQNLDAIKEETAAIGSSRINQAIKGLTSEAANRMFKDGKVSYEGMGEIMSGVSQVKQLKNYWTNAAELKKQYLQLGASTNKDMTSLSSFVAKIDPLIAENEGGSIEDLKKKLSSLYDSHLDYANQAREKISSLFPADKYVGTMENEKKGITEYSFTAPKDLFAFDTKSGKPVLAAPTIVTDETGKPVIDKATGQPKTITSLEKAKAALSQGDPGYFDRYRNHYGLSKALVSDDAVTLQVLNSFANQPQFKEIKSFEQIETEKNNLKISSNEAANIGTITSLKIKQMRQAIATAKAQEKKYLSSGSGAGGFPKNYVKVTPITTKDGSTRIPLTGNITITATGANYEFRDKKTGEKQIRRGALGTRPGEAQEFKVTAITKDRDGHIWASGYATVNGVATGAKEIMMSKRDYNDFIGKLGGMSATERFSNSLGLAETGFPGIPKTYLNIQQDTTPDKGWEDVE